MALLAKQSCPTFAESPASGNMEPTQSITSFFQPRNRLKSNTRKVWSYGMRCTMTLNWRGVEAISYKTVSTYRVEFGFPPLPLPKIPGSAPEVSFFSGLSFRQSHTQPGKTNVTQAIKPWPLPVIMYFMYFFSDYTKKSHSSTLKSLVRFMQVLKNKDKFGSEILARRKSVFCVLQASLKRESRAMRFCVRLRARLQNAKIK